MDLGRWGKLARAWALLVKNRDGWKCKHCGFEKKEELQAHHIVPWKKSIELRFDINNGLTLCKSCHYREDRKIGDFKIGEWSKDRKFTDEHKEKLSNAKKGKTPWNKGKKGVQISTRKGIKMSEEQKIKISNTKKGSIPWNKGRTGASWKIDDATGKRIYTTGFTAS
jgi:hypothetical protein